MFLVLTSPRGFRLRLPGRPVRYEQVDEMRRLETGYLTGRGQELWALYWARHALLTIAHPVVWAG